MIMMTSSRAGETTFPPATPFLTVFINYLLTAGETTFLATASHIADCVGTPATPFLTVFVNYLLTEGRGRRGTVGSLLIWR